MKPLARITAVFDRTLNLLAYLAAALIAFIMLSVSYEVVMRYFFNRPPVWVIDITEILLLYIAFLAVAWLLREEGHVRMDMVLTRLKSRPQATLNIITSTICAIIFLVVTWYGVRVTWVHFQKGLYSPTFLDIPSAYSLVIIPVGSFLLFIQFLRRIRRFVGNWRASDKEQGYR